MQRRLVAFTVAAIASLGASSVFAETWRWFPVKGGAVAFDQDSVKNDIATGTMTANTLIYYEAPRPVGARTYSFVVERLAFECRSDRHRWSQSAILDAAGAVIVTREDGDWTTTNTDKGSTGLFRRMICMGQTPPGGKPAKDLATLIVAMTPKAAPAAKVAIAPPPTSAPLDLDALMASLAQPADEKPKPPARKSAPRPVAKPKPPAPKPTMPKLRPLTLP